MHYCISLKSFLSWIFTILIFLFASQAAATEGIVLNKAEAKLTEEGYRLSADYSIHLSQTVETALKHGITLYFISELSISRSRWYWFDTEVANDEQVIKLSYNALTQQYRITRGALFQTFFGLEEALQVLGHQTASPIATNQLDKTAGGYFSRLMKKGSECCTGYARLRLDLSQLPKPLQVNALTNDDWNLESKPHQWAIEPPASGEQP